MSNLPAPQIGAVETALVMDDLSKLTAEQRLSYYNQVCESVGLNPLTQPFAYIVLNGRLKLYARKEASEQLRKIHGVSSEILSQQIDGDYFNVHIRARDKMGRTDEDVSSIFVKGLSGNDLANARMKGITKAKRRVTLSICGLGMLDESELDTIPDAVKDVTVNPQLPNPIAEHKEQQEAKKVDPGSYVITFGKHKGKMLKELDMFGLDNYVKWVKDSAAKEKRPVTGVALQFVETAEAYLTSLEVNQEHESIVDALDSKG